VRLRGLRGGCCRVLDFLLVFLGLRFLALLLLLFAVLVFLGLFETGRVFLFTWLLSTAQFTNWCLFFGVCWFLCHRKLFEQKTQKGTVEKRQKRKAQRR